MAEFPMTRLPGQYREEPKVVKKYVPAKPPAIVPHVPRRPPRVNINEDRLLVWIASVKDAAELVPFYNSVNARLRSLGVRPPRSLPARQGSVCESVNFSGDELVRWITNADKDELPRLQNVSAAMRLRIVGQFRPTRTGRRRRVAKRRGR